MSDTPQITHERVDDIPLLMHVMTDRLQLHALLDQIRPRHGNWQGLSLGQVMVTWLTHILSECTHAMSPVREWANRLQHTLACLLGQELRDTDLSDDRLAEVLRILSLDAVWHPLEQAVTQRMIRVYHLPTQRVRLDGTTVSIHSGNEASILFQRGHSKDHRPDLPQLKAMLATLDPLGVLVGVDVVAGQRADDGLYVPAITRLRTTLAANGLLYIGDCKMSALATRAYLQTTDNFYLMPLAQVGSLPADMDKWIEAALNQTDLNAVEEALRIKEAQGGEVVLVSLGPQKAADSLRKALAMGADRSVLVTDDAAAGSDLLGTSRVLAAALEREAADLVLFGQASSDGDGAVLWAAVADRLRRPFVSQVASLTVDAGSVTGKRQTEHGYDVISAPLPAVVAVSDAINEPRYPSLKGIMGAKTKPQESLALADLGVAPDDAGDTAARTTVLDLGPPPSRGGQVKIEDDGSAAQKILDLVLERRLL